MLGDERVVEIRGELRDLPQVLGENAQLVVVEGIDVDGGVRLVGGDVFLLALVDGLGADDGLTQGVAAALVVADHAAGHPDLLGVDDAVARGDDARAGRDIDAGRAVTDGVEEQGIEHWMPSAMMTASRLPSMGV